ncbi:MAG TPA: hypothetical protein PKZ53_17710, partial [Acidobacteriota bacterium]|nr:hypothetical protein [Acidobacteriota bacterium]
VGAIFDSIGAATTQGSAYVFVRTGTTWSQQQKLTASDGAATDRFGSSVVISGETVVVGAFSDNIGANGDQGSAYVFVRTGTTWSQQQQLTASDGAANDRFGNSVAISGETVVVGAQLDDIGANTDQGSVYVFVRIGTIWTEQQKLTASDGAPDDLFGGAVAISGETIVVGVNSADIGANSDQGSASVFVRTGMTWTERQKLTASDGVASAFLGSSVAISGETLVVGAPNDTIGANADQGSASVFVLDCDVMTYPSLLFVADTGNNRIQKFDGDVWTVVAGSLGSGIGQFRVPEAVTADMTGTLIYVADTGNNRVQWSTDSGATWRIFASFGAGPNQVRAPQGLALDSNGNLYVADTGNNRVLRFLGGVPGTGEILLSGGRTNEVSSPQGLAIDEMFNLYVADTGNSRVLKVLNADQPSVIRQTVANSGSSANQVRQAQGVAVDADGNLYVADTGNNRVLKFVGGEAGMGVVLATIGSAVGQVRGAEGVAVNVFAAGPLAGITVLAVGDTSNNRIQGLDLSSVARPESSLTVGPAIGTWQLLGTPNNIGSQVGKFRSPGKIK